MVGGKGGGLLGIAKTLGSLAIAGIALEKLVEQWGTFQAGGAAGAETLRQQTAAGVPLLSLADAKAALRATQEQLGNPINDLALKLSGTFDQVKATEKALMERIAYLEGGGTGTGKTGGRGDESTAREVKRLGDRQALAARVVAAGGEATASRLAAIMEKNARASASGDDRIAGNIDRLNRTVSAKDFSPTIKVGSPVVNVNTGFTISVRNTRVATATWSRYNTSTRTPTTFEDTARS